VTFLKPAKFRWQAHHLLIAAVCCNHLSDSGFVGRLVNGRTIRQNELGAIWSPRIQTLSTTKGSLVINPSQTQIPWINEKIAFNISVTDIRQPETMRYRLLTSHFRYLPVVISANAYRIGQALQVTFPFGSTTRVAKCFPAICDATLMAEDSLP